MALPENTTATPSRAGVTNSCEPVSLARVYIPKANYDRLPAATYQKPAQTWPVSNAKKISNLELTHGFDYGSPNLASPARTPISKA